MALCDIVMDCRSLALRDEAMALCDEAVVLMLLWKLAPINDIADNAVCTAAILSRPRRVLQPSSGLVSRKSLRSGAQRRCSIDYCKKARP